ncbi:acyl-CoA desaturase [Candidatus Sumerlaeota bacterium]|nr:acyl-CoA desaturase [Candidatus Sumerlaeota bacterium]
MTSTTHQITRRLRPLINWFDSWAGDPEEHRRAPDRPDWIRIIPLIAFHLVCFGVIWVGWSPVAVGTAVALYFIRMFAITGFYHRYFSHRTFSTSRVAQFLFAFLGATSAQRGPLWWAAHHRKHHRHADQECDVHSPRQHGFLWSHILWFTTRPNFPTDLKVVKDLARYPELRWLDRFDIVPPTLLAVALFGFGSALGAWAPELGTSGMQMLIWGFFISTVALIHGTCTINSLAHQFGRRRYDTPDDSRNSFLLALLTLGEGWHNNHHHFPGSTRQGFYWWEIDITHWLLWLLSKTGIIWRMHPVPERALNSNRIAPEARPS